MKDLLAALQTLEKYKLLPGISKARVITRPEDVTKALNKRRKKMSRETFDEIKRLDRGNWKPSEIAAELDVHVSSVQRVKSGSMKRPKK